jgi:glycosyltransferase involved in cell wall biosynthesis
VPKVSVIIPVYNVEKYLGECLDSVLRQTLKDIEIICVNDGSTDGSAKMLAEYAAKDPRIRIITQANAGLSAARNAGMDAACGKYIYFLDSDDYIKDDAMAKCFSICERDGLDQLSFNCECLFEDKSMDIELLRKKAKSYLLPSELSDTVLTGAEALERLRDLKCFCVCVPFRMMRLECLRNAGLRFMPGIIHEDDLFTPVSLCEALRVELIQDALYIRRFRPSSIVTARGSEAKAKSLTSFLAVYLLMEKEFAKRDYARRFPSLAAKYFVRERRRIANNARVRTAVAAFLELARHVKGRDLARGRMLLVTCALRRAMRTARRRLWPTNR